MKTTFKIGGELEVNRVGYGAMQLTGAGVFGEVADRPNAIEVLKAAAEAGVNFFDTADAYGPNTNEVLIADALFPYKSKNIVVATKGGLVRPGPGNWVPNGQPDYIRGCIEGSLKRLNVDVIDLWQLHRIDSHVPVEKTLAPVAEAVKVGKIRYVGLSEVNVEQIKAAQKIVPIASVQNLYNLKNRQWEDVVDYTAKNKMAFIPWFPLASGPDAMAGSIEKMAKARGVSIAQIALAWLLKRSDNILLIPGTKSLSHLTDNLGAKNIVLSDAEFETLR